ncbi:MAG: sodium:solute symporter [Planctomycetota bacterium]
MHGIDYAIVAVYLIGLVVTGVVLARKAAASADDYFLAGRKTPWWALGASGMSSNLDAAGTMTILTLIYLYGLHGFFIEMRGGVVLPIAVFLAFMGKWHQRSRVVTTGEWMLLRFGQGWQGRAARYTAAATYLIITVGMVVFFLAAAGKFLAVFLPFDETTCAVAMAVVALGYTMISGLYGVIWTDVFQAFLIGAAAIYVSVLAFTYVTPELLDAWPGAAFNTIIPQMGGGLAREAIDADGAAFTQTSYAPFLLFLLFWAGKGVLEGLGGSGGSAYMAQRFYAARDVPTVKKLCMLWTVLFAFRWPMVLGFAILAIHLGIGREDPENILPAVLQSDLIPIGVTGLLVSAIFAASMSTFDSTINAGASYVVRDLVLPLRPGTTQKGQVIAGYLASVGIVAAGLTLALLFAEGVVDVWVTIVIQLFPAFLIPFALRWFWARFNGLGFSLGVATGFAGAFTLTFVDGPADLGWPDTLGVLVQNGAFTDVFILGTVGLCSLIGCLLGTFAAPAIDADTLEAFYRQIKPIGLWPAAWKQPDRSEHRGDVVRLIVALGWQTATFLLPMALLLHLWWPSAFLAFVFVGLGFYLLRDLRHAPAVQLT